MTCICVVAHCSRYSIHCFYPLWYLWCVPSLHVCDVLCLSTGQAYGQDNMDSPYGASPYGPNGYQGYQGSPADSPYGTAQRRPNDSGVYSRSPGAPSSSSSGPPSTYGVPPHSRPTGIPLSASSGSQSSLGSPLGSTIGSSSAGPTPSDPDIRFYPATPTQSMANPFSGPDSSYGSLGRNSPHYMKQHPGVHDPYGSLGRSSPQGTLSGTDSYGSLGRQSPYMQSPGPGGPYRYPAPSPLAQSSPSGSFMYPPNPLASPRYDSPGGPLYSPRHPSSPGPLSSAGPPPQSPGGPRYTSSPSPLAGSRDQSPSPYGPGHYGTYHPGSRGPSTPGSYASLPADYRRRPGAGASPSGMPCSVVGMSRRLPLLGRCPYSVADLTNTHQCTHEPTLRWPPPPLPIY